MRIAPSVLAAHFAKLKDEIQSVESGNIDLLHLDVMDGHFVPNITFGPQVVKAIRDVTSCELDVHLMIEHPEEWLQAFADAGASYISVHAEVSPHLHRTIQAIQALGVKAGVALNPSTPLEAVEYVLEDLDYVLLMTVNPGFGGQSFIPQMIDKIKRLKNLMEHIGRVRPIEVDGGINLKTIKTVKDAGASWFVAGSAIFGAQDRPKAISDLINTCKS